MIRGPSFSLWRAPLRPALRGLFRRITLYRSDGPLPGLMVEPAALVVPLILVFDGAFEIGMGRDPREFIARDPDGNLWCFGTWYPKAP